MARGGKKKEMGWGPWPSAALNNETYLQWEMYFKNIAINVYRWENLPDSCDSRWLELCLYEQGFCLFFQDPDLLRYLTLQCFIQGPWDVYNIPIYRTAYATNDYRCPRNNTNSVLIFNNYTHTPSRMYAQLYARRVYEIERAIDVNVKGQKTPIMFKGTEQQRLSLKNLMMQYDGNEPYIFLPIDNMMEVEVLKTDSPFVAPGLFQLKQFYINEFLTIMGVENSNQDKKAQMTQNEIGANYGQVEISRYTGLQARQMAADQINDMFGLDVKVNVSSRIDTLVNRPFRTDGGEDYPGTDMEEFDEPDEPSDDVPSEDEEEDDE